MIHKGFYFGPEYTDLRVKTKFEKHMDNLN